MEELLYVFLIGICFAAGLIAAAGAISIVLDIIDKISKSKNAESKKKKHYDKLKRTLQKSVQKIGSKDTLKNLKMAMYQIDGLVEFKDKLIALANEKENFELRMDLSCKDYRIKKLEEALEGTRNKNSDNGNA